MKNLSRLMFVYFVVFQCFIEAGSWSAASDLSKGSSENPQLAASTDGTKAIVVWQRYDGNYFIIESINTADGGGTWGTAIGQSLTGQNAENPQAAISSDGSKSIVCWSRFDGANNIIQASISIDGGNTWSSPINVSQTGQNAKHPQVMLSSDGSKAILCWMSNHMLQGAASADGGATWSLPATLSAGGNGNNPQGAMSLDGSNAMIVWANYDGSNSVINAIRSADGGATWSSPVEISLESQYTDSPHVAMSSDGSKALVTCSRLENANYLIQAITTSDGGNSWNQPIDVSASGQNSLNPELALSSDGSKAVIIWWEFDGTNSVVQTIATNDGGETWSLPVNLAQSGQNGTYPRVVISSNAAQAIAVWWAINGRQYNIQSVSTSDGGATWGTPIELSTAGENTENAQISVSSDGSRAICVWLRYDGMYVVQASAESTN